MTDNFKDLELQRTYSSLHCNLVDNLINPLLELSHCYDRAVGFFSSKWLKEVSIGMARFIAQKGQARIVTSIQISLKDWKSIHQGQMSIDDLITQTVAFTLSDLQRSLEDETLSILSWMVAKEIVDFRFAVPIGRLQGGIFHTKLALFYDQNENGIAVFGSQNDSEQANYNEETLNIFTSWGAEKEYFKDHERSFFEKWNGNNVTLKTYPIPEAAKILMIKGSKKTFSPEEALKFKLFKKLFVPQKKISMPQNLQLRDYQKDAIESWKKNNHRGLFEMATGTGKTLTAITATVELYQLLGKLALIILVPYQHLVTQWKKELEKFHFKPICCYKKKDLWYHKANVAIREYKAGISDNICLVSTHKTSSLEYFKTIINRMPDDWLLLVDEVHHLGSEKYQASLFPEAKFRIGLSATPSRWYDYKGTKFIEDYFEKKVIEYGLAEAIEGEFLTPYEYTPILVELTDEELYDYEQLTMQIAQLYSKKDEEPELFKCLLLKRSKIVGGAISKVDTLENLVMQHQQQCEDDDKPYIHNLYYCNPGEHKEALMRISNLGIKVHEFVHTTPAQQRSKILEAFANGELQGLVAVNCLDEGVDVPVTKRAYILASTTNPLQYIQRRGRILRKFPGKYKALLYDFMVGPWTPKRYDKKIGKNLLDREISRFHEFNKLATNTYSNIEKIEDFCKYFGVDQLFKTCKVDINGN